MAGLMGLHDMFFSFEEVECRAAYRRGWVLQVTVKSAALGFMVFCLSKLTGFLDVEPALPIPGFGVRVASCSCRRTS